jgi:hypothetical protein
MTNDKVECRIMRETDAALLLRQEMPNREPVEAWVPRSLCAHISKRPKEGVEGVPATVTMAQWKAEQLNLHGVEA